MRVPYGAIRGVRVGLGESPHGLVFRVGLNAWPFGDQRRGTFWVNGRCTFLDYADRRRAVVVELDGHRFARVAVEPDTDPQQLADQIRERTKLVATPPAP